MLRTVNAPASATRLTGLFVFNDSVLPSLPVSNFDVTSAITDFSFTDGNQTITNANASSFSFNISLDANGNMVPVWNIQMAIDSPSGSLIAFIKTGSSGDQSTGPISGKTYSVANGDNPGTWTFAALGGGGETPVPAPPDLMVFLPALLALGAASRWRLRKSGTAQQECAGASTPPSLC